MEAKAKMAEEKKKEKEALALAEQKAATKLAVDRVTQEARKREEELLRQLAVAKKEPGPSTMPTKTTNQKKGYEGCLPSKVNDYDFPHRGLDAVERSFAISNHNIQFQVT